MKIAIKSLIGGLLPVLPQFVGVDDVLPEDVAAGTDAGDRVQEGVGNPDGEAGILLEHGLTGTDVFANSTTNKTADDELHERGEKGQEGNGS